jgi:hypothetical protein
MAMKFPELLLLLLLLLLFAGGPVYLQLTERDHFRSNALSSYVLIPTMLPLFGTFLELLLWNMRVHPKVSGLAAWSQNCKWYSSLPLGAVASLFCESV